MRGTLWATLGRWLYRDANARGGDWAWQRGYGTSLTVLMGVEVVPLVVVYLLVREPIPGKSPSSKLSESDLDD
ncbi:hypothetical protein ACNS7O_00150 [Haloferacaceae archaeon DSL9]